MVNAELWYYAMLVLKLSVVHKPLILFELFTEVKKQFQNFSKERITTDIRILRRIQTSLLGTRSNCLRQVHVI